MACRAQLADMNAQIAALLSRESELMALVETKELCMQQKEAAAQATIAALEGEQQRLDVQMR